MPPFLRPRNIFPTYKGMEKNLVALDLGRGSLGISISRSGRFVSPLKNLRFKNGDFAYALTELKEILSLEKVSKFILGLPLFPSGDECERTKVVYSFKGRLSKAFPFVPIVLQDERYSTLEASSLLHEKGERAKKQHKSIDAVASCVILERYLRSIGQAD